jgi:hypothetical protein
MSGEKVLSVEETQMVQLIQKIVADTVHTVACVTFENTNEVVVSKEKLMSIMCVAGATCYEAGRTGVYVTPYPDIPKQLIN